MHITHIKAHIMAPLTNNPERTEGPSMTYFKLKDCMSTGRGQLQKSHFFSVNFSRQSIYAKSKSKALFIGLIFFFVHKIAKAKKLKN